MQLASDIARVGKATVYLYVKRYVLVFDHLIELYFASPRPIAIGSKASESVVSVGLVKLVFKGCCMHSM